jgi:hypothetical protein
MALVSNGCSSTGQKTVGFKVGGAPAPRGCIKSHNGSPSAVSWALHSYGDGHQSRAAHVFRMTDRSVPLINSCVVIYAAAEDDREYGILGEVDYLTAGWDTMANLSLTPSKRAALQKLGATQANAALRSDGTLVPLETRTQPASRP